MNKRIFLPLTLPLLLTACASDAVPQQNAEYAPPAEIQRAEVDLPPERECSFGGFARDIVLPPVSGVKRILMHSPVGSYSVEYVHTPPGMAEDDTLDYKLEISDDGSFTLNVVSEGVSADHSGRWYTRRDELMLFYDEKVDTPAHNVYIADSMYADILPGQKLMIYDNCRVIVLAKSADAQ